LICWIFSIEYAQLKYYYCFLSEIYLYTIALDDIRRYTVKDCAHQTGVTLAKRWCWRLVRVARLQIMTGGAQVADLESLAQAIIKGKAPDAKALTEAALAEGVPAGDVLNKGLVAGMNVVGELFKTNQYYVPEVLIAARAMKQSMEILKPALAAGGVESKGKIAIGTVRGDYFCLWTLLHQQPVRVSGFP
jgi:hypothetical protein